MTQPIKVMLIDDDASMQVLIEQIVRRGGYDFCCASNGADGLAMLRAARPDFLILDVMLPDINGFEICEIIRGEGRKVPIMFLTAKGDIVDKGVGFAAGGDDYMVKPFDPRELMMHIEAHLRRAAMRPAAAAPATGVIEVGRLSLDMAQHRAFLGGEHVALTPKEFKILATLASSPGTVFSREQLVEAAWGPEFVGETSSITVFIKKLRAKVEADPTEPRLIETVWGIGYRLDPEACG